MLALAAQLPEYPVVMSMRGVGDSLGPQLMAEIGDVARFARRSAITSFAGVDPGVNKFLRIYYGRVKEYLAVLEQPSVSAPEEYI